MQSFLNLFGFKNKDKPKEEFKKETFVHGDVDGAYTIEYTHGGFFTNISTLQVEETLRRTSDQIKAYRAMAMHPEADKAIEEICNEAITSSKTEDLVSIDLEQVEGLSDNVKKKITDEFHGVLKLLNYKKKSFDLFRDFYIDGRLYFHKIIDEGKSKEGIVELRQIDSTAISKVVEMEKERDPETNADIITKTKEYYIYNRTYAQYHRKSTFNSSIAISPDAICFIHSGLYNIDRTMIHGWLQKVIKPLNQLRMVEDAAVIYRLTRAPERRAFYIDVGRLPRHKAEQHVQEVMNRHRNQLQYDATSGEIIDNKKHMHMLEDFFLPRFDGSRGTQIEMLEGGKNLGEMDDILYFQKKLYRALNVPITRLDPDSGFALGRATEISRDEVNYSKFVDRILIRFSGMFDDLLGTQLVLKKIMRQDEWDAIKNDIFYDFLKDSFFQELKEMEIMRDRVALLNEMSDLAEPAKYFSKEWLNKNILQFDDEDIKEMDKQIEQEKKDREEEMEDMGLNQFGLPMQQPGQPGQEQGQDVGPDLKTGKGNFTPVGGSAAQRANQKSTMAEPIKSPLEKEPKG